MRRKIKRIFIELMWLIWRLNDQEGKFLQRMRVWFGSLGLCSTKQQRGAKAIKFLKREGGPALNSVLLLVVYQRILKSLGTEASCISGSGPQPENETVALWR